MRNSRVILVGACALALALVLAGWGAVRIKLGIENYGKNYWTQLFRESAKAEARFDALDAVSNSAPFVSEFIRLFPGAEVNYRYFTTDDDPGFDVEVDLYERYEFGMQLPVQFDPERRKVIGYGEPKFYLWEVASQKGSETSYNPSGERHFGSSEWRTLVEHRGDFSAIGYEMRTNQPVAGFRNRKSQP